MLTGLFKKYNFVRLKLYILYRKKNTLNFKKSAKKDIVIKKTGLVGREQSQGIILFKYGLFIKKHKTSNLIKSGPYITSV